MKNLNDLLPGSDAAKDGFAHRLLFDPANEFFRDLKINVGFEQSQPDLAQSAVDVRLADRPVTAQILEDVLKFIAELRKHKGAKA